MRVITNRIGASFPAPRIVSIPFLTAAAVVLFGSFSIGGDAEAASPKLDGSIVVSAASSLTQTFSTLASEFEKAHPGTSISFNFGSSGALAIQIVSGAPADVFASASPSDMETVQQAGDLAGKPITFARNSLELVVKPGNPLRIQSLADLLRANVVAICVDTAPCGSTANEALAKAKVDLPTSKITLGQDVDSTLSEVTTGDADAAIVYVTNARTIGAQGTAVPIRTRYNVTTSYPIATIKSTKNRSLAAAWIAFVVGTPGQKALHESGFLPPR
jgi:molybdate transport system substrate-binding protein